MCGVQGRPLTLQPRSLLHSSEGAAALVDVAADAQMDTLRLQGGVWRADAERQAGRTPCSVP